MTQLAATIRCWLGWCCAALAVACGGPAKPTEHPIVGMAAFDLQCPKAQLSYTQIDRGTWGVTGCGKQTKYVRLCRQVGSGWMIEDDCRWVQN